MTATRYHGAVRKLSLRIDARLPERGPARVAVVAWLALGALVAISVRVFLGVVVWGTLTAPR